MSERAVLELTGGDMRKFLQDLVTNDLGGLDRGLVYAALLTPQGKYLFDFFLVPAGGAILIDVAADRAEAPAQRLAMYRLRADVQITVRDRQVTRGTGPAPDGAFADPRHPALGWRAIRVGLDKPGVLRMQLQALIRAAAGRALTVMFPFVAQYEEYTRARAEVDKALERERRLGHALPSEIEIGAMLETPSLAFAPRKFFEEVGFLSIGGNDLKQFFFAADRENERVRRRYDTLNVSFLSFIERIVERCGETGTPLSFCGEDAGRPVEAICLAAIGVRTLSMRPASIGPVKSLLRRVPLPDLRKVIADARHRGDMNVRPAVMEWLRAQ